MHPRVIAEGFDLARDRVLAFLDTFKVPIDERDRDMLCSVARTSLRTKLIPALADQLTEIVTDAILCIAKPQQPVDLHMVEILHVRCAPAAFSIAIVCLLVSHPLLNM